MWHFPASFTHNNVFIRTATTETWRGTAIWNNKKLCLPQRAVSRKVEKVLWVQTCHTFLITQKCNFLKLVWEIFCQIQKNNSCKANIFPVSYKLNHYLCTLYKNGKYGIRFYQDGQVLILPSQGFNFLKTSVHGHFLHNHVPHHQ